MRLPFFHSTPSIKHSLQVTSFGGAGTTMLYSFLESTNADLPDASHDWIPWKHMTEPPADRDVPDGFRAIYLFSNPMNAVLSVFRRGYQHWHAERMVNGGPAWNDEWELEDMLELDYDPFRMDDHFQAWAEADRSYPILLVRFDALWDHLPELLAFAGVRSTYHAAFPEHRPRNSDWTQAEPEIRDWLDTIYGPFAQRLDDTPDFIIR